MDIIFLGTNGWFDTYTGNTTCTLVETKNAYIILDAGGGIYKTYDIIKGKKPVYLLLSHLHMDHISGLQTLPLFSWAGGLTIIVPPGMQAELAAIMRPPFLPAAASLKTKTTVAEFGKTGDLPFKLTALPLEHAVPTLGYRIEADDKILTYATDTGVSDNIVKLAQGADLLITECSYLPGQSPDNNHLNPEQAAAMAAQAKAKVLALIHFKADTYNTLQTRDGAMAAAGAIFPHTIAPYDGDNICV